MISEAIRAIPGLKEVFGPGDIPVHGQPVNYFTGLLDRERDPRLTVGDGRNTSLVEAIINWYLDNYPEALLTVTGGKPGERMTIAPHGLTDLIAAPNEFYGEDELMAGMIFSDIIDGNSYFLKLRNRSKRVAELWWIPHTIIEPKGGQKPEDPFIKYYEYRPSGRRYELDISEVVHIRHGLDPENPRKGRSRLKGQMREIMTDEEAARMTAALAQNLGVPGLVISPKDSEATIDEDAAGVIKAKMDQGTGASNRGRTVVISGATDLHQFGFSPEQMSMRDIRGIPEERVSAALRVPAAVVGFGTGLAQSKVGATMRELREMATEDALIPLWRRVAKALQRQLLYEFKGSRQDLKVEYDITEVRMLQEDKDKAHARDLAALTGSAITRRQFQIRQGYPPDEGAEGEVYLQSSLVVEVPATVAAPRRGVRALKDNRNGHRAKLTPSQRTGLAFVRYLERGRVPIERRTADALEAAYAGFAALAAEAYDAVPKGRKQTPDDERIAAEIIERIDPAAYQAATLAPIHNGAYAASAELAVQGLDDAFDVTLAIGERDLVAERVLAAGGQRLGLSDLTAQTREAVYRALAVAREEGLGIPETARRIRELVGVGPFPGAGSAYRAETVARTETRWAVNRAVGEAGRAAGFTEYVAFDDRTGFGDDECVARDGATFGYDDMISESDHPRGTLSFSPVPRTEGERVEA